jgi:hypothetical protein
LEQRNGPRGMSIGVVLAALALLTRCGGTMEMEAEPSGLEAQRSSMKAEPRCMPRTDTYLRVDSASMDGSVSQNEPGRNFGSAPTLNTDGVPRQDSYLQFRVNTGGMAVRQAWLELQATSATTNGPKLYQAQNDWSERGLTWNKRPALGARLLGNLGAISTHSRVTFDLTGTVTDSEPYSFGLIAEAGDSVSFASSESADEGTGPALHYVLETPSFCSYRGAGGLTSWVRQHGGEGHEELDAMARHPEGGFVVAGRFGDAPFPLGEGLALARYSVTGVTLWRRVVIAEKVRVTHLTVTPLGNILVVGNYHGSPDLGAGALPAIPEEEPWAGFFIAKFSPRGENVWARGFASRGDLGRYQPVAPYAVATDADGSLLVTGIFSGAMNLGGGTLRSNTKGRTGYSWGEGGFVAKFTWEGHHVWSRAFQSGDEPAFAGFIYGSTVAADEEGNVLVGGSASASTDLGDGRLRYRAPFLAKYSPTGSLLWKHVFRGAYGEVAEVRPQGSGAVVFAGNFGDAFQFAGKRYVGGDPEASYPEVPNTNGFLGALTASGEDAWMTSVGTGTGFTVWFNELEVSEDGALTVTGQGEGVFNLGGGTLGFSLGFSPWFSTRRGFVARYSAQGQHQWSRVLDHDRDFKLATQPGGGVVLGSSLSGRLELEGTPRIPQGTSDLLFLRLDPSP